MAEWLRRQTWNLLGFSRTGSNPVGSEFFYQFLSSLHLILAISYSYHIRLSIIRYMLSIFEQMNYVPVLIIQAITIRHNVASRYLIVLIKKNSLPTGFEPVRENPNRFQVCRLNHSAIVASYSVIKSNSRDTLI